MVRGSEENCINGNKLNQQQTEDVVQFLFCFDRSFPFDLDELAQFVKELLDGRTCFFCHCTGEGSARLWSQRSGLLPQRAWGQEMPRHKNPLAGARRPASECHELPNIISEVLLSNVFHCHTAAFSEFLENSFFLFLLKNSP